MLTTSLGRFRLVGALEALSFLALLGIAMPLKYGFGMPLPVKVVGWAHGVLFLAYLAALFGVWNEHRWSLARVALALVAALLPAGPFVFDAWLRRATTPEQRPAA